MKQLTTTSYAILALLAVRPWSAYELAGQGRRQMGWFWPRGERGMYNEAKNLVTHGLAEASAQRRGRQHRTEYSINDAGRGALKAWMGQPSVPPHFESEALVRLAFAEHSSMADATATLAGLQEHVRQRRHEVRLFAREYVEGEVPYPDRLHLITLITRFFADYFEMMDNWTSWADEQMTAWDGQIRTGDPAQAMAVLERIAALAPHTHHRHEPPTTPPAAAS